jgi:molybdopterin synthase catalytic subunit/molybdopterin converting factor small subunit
MLAMSEAYAGASLGGVQVSVRLFAGLRQRAGSDRVALELPDGASVADALHALRDVTAGTTCVLAVNRVYAGDEQVLEQGDELALIPPVSGGADPHVAVLGGPLSLDALYAHVRDPRAGAVVTFSGLTREVSHLDYEAYAEMAEPVMREIVAEAIARHGLCAAAAEHRHGRVALSEPSVIVAASAPHRPEAFAGAREIIDRIKATAPIWKAEEGSWVEGVLPE